MPDTTVRLSGKGSLRGHVYAPSRVLDTSDCKLVRLENGAEYYVPSELLHPRRDGSYELDLNPEQLAQYDASRRIATPAPAGEAVSFTQGNTIPLIAEEVNIGKNVHQSTVRIEKVVTSRDVTVDDPLTREEFEIRRVPVNKVIPEPIPPRQEGDTFILPVFEEVLVTETRLLLREEVHIVRRRVEVHDPRTITLRREEIQVRRVENDGPSKRR
jgi:uncharacterized protein (TIGR02271 family)